MTDSTTSLRASLLDRLAAQWIALGVTLTGRPDEDLIDIEALVALTAELGQEDARVYEGAVDWCTSYGAAVNVGRLRTVAAEMAIDVARLGTFAALLSSAGGPRWPFPGETAYRYEPRGKVHIRTLRTAAALAWRLRSAFGVTARADILAILAAAGGREMTVADLARLARFTKRNVALTVQSLALADVLEVDRIGNELRVKLTGEPGFRAWLEPTPCGYVDWVGRFAVAVRALGFAVPATAPASVRAIEARVLMTQLAPLIRRTGLPLPDTSAMGEAFNAAFDQWCSRLADAFTP